MLILAIAALLLATDPAPLPPAADPVLFVFAHPDDEIFIAPLAAALARHGVPMVVAFATQRERGVPPDGSIAAEPGLAIIRRAEAGCSAAILGIAPPHFLGFQDGGLGDRVQPTNARLTALGNAIRALVTDVAPRAIVTWGPDGGYGHPDHRLVSAVTTEVVLGIVGGPPLYFPGVPADALAAHPQRVIAWTGVDPALLTMRVPFVAADAAGARAAATCHRSQFGSPQVVDAIEADLIGALGGAIHLRPARPTHGNPFR